MRTKAWTVIGAFGLSLLTGCNGVVVTAIAAGATGAGGATSAASSSASSTTGASTGGSAPCGSGVPPQPVVELTPPEAWAEIGPITVDAASVYYFAEPGDLRRVPDDGGAVAMLATKLGAWQGSGLVVDATNLYWADPPTGPCKMVSCTNNVGIHALSKQGGAPTYFVHTENVSGIAIDSSDLYWTNPSAVMKAALAGGTPTQIASLTAPGDAIVVDATNAYWTTRENAGTGRVQSAPLGGGAVTTLAPMDATKFPRGIAVGGDQVYWTGQELAMVPIGGGSVTHFPGPGPAVAVTTDATHVYWTQVSSSVDSAVCKMPLGGGPVVTLAVHQAISDRNGALAVDATSVYWSDGTVIRKTAK